MLSDAKTTAALPEEGEDGFPISSPPLFRRGDARRPQGDDELQAAGGPPLLAHRHLQRLRHDRILHTLCLPPQHGHSHRSLSPGRLLPCVGNVAPFLIGRFFLFAGYWDQ